MAIQLLIHLLILMVFPPLLLGMISRTKALFAGRSGPPLLQPYYDLHRLWHKGFVISRTTTWVFRVGPIVGLVSPLLASLLLPFGAVPAPFSFNGDLILFVYLFALSRFFTACAALDTGSSFEGMGTAREVTFSCLVEPTIFFSLVVLARLSGGFSLNQLLGNHLTKSWQSAGASLLLLVIVLFVVLLVENCRIPFDDPNTHLELTMIHEVMVLDHSGPSFGMIIYASSLKLFVFGSLLMRILIPWESGHLAIDVLIFMAGMLTLAVAIGVVESVMARLQLIRIPQLLIGTTLLSIFALVLVLR